MFDVSQFDKLTTGMASQPSVYGYNVGSDSFSSIMATGYFNAAIDQVNTGDKVLLSTSTAGLSYSGTFRNDGTNVYVDWDKTFFTQGVFSNISGAASNIWLPTHAGLLVALKVIQYAAITVANNVISFSLNSVAIAGATITVPTSGNPGAQYISKPTAPVVCDGTIALEASSNGASTGACVALVEAKFIGPAQI